MKIQVIKSLLIIALIIGCKSSNGSSNTNPTLRLSFEAKSGSKTTGTATFIEKNGKVTFTAKIAGLSPGSHAIHIHEKADCSAADGSSAGGHWNPTFKKHGRWGDVECHKGDIGNFTADGDGNGMITLTTDQWCIGCGDPTKDVIGKGLIVHEKADDFVTQPTGNAGGRMACSTIIQ